MEPIRTTLSLDADNASALEEIQRCTGMRKSELLNAAIRLGLRKLESSPSPRKPYRTVPVDPGSPAVSGVHSVHDLIAFTEA